MRASFAPVPEGTQRPRWSVMIPTYNCAGFLRETLASEMGAYLNAFAAKCKEVLAVG